MIPSSRTLPGAALVPCLALLAACAEPPLGEDVVARVDDWTLSTDRLGELLVLAQPFPLDPEPVGELVRHWVGVSALVRSAGSDGALTGDSAVAASTWLERREALLLTERESRLGGRVPVVTRADFLEGSHRLVAHVLRRVGPETSPEERELQRRTAERILSELRAGGSWDRAVAQSEDPATVDASGLLGLVGPGDLPEPLDAAAFALEPGHVSSVIESSRGYHVLYRPLYRDVADLFARRLRERRLEEADAAAAEELARRRDVRAAEGAFSRLRAMAGATIAPLEWLDRETPMATWDDGGLGAGTVARYVTALPRSSRQEMLRAGDDDLAELLEDLAVREIRTLEARASHPDTVRALEDRLRSQHLEEVEEWLVTLGIDGDGPAGEEVVDRYMERLVARQVQQRPLAPLFRAWLLRRVDWALWDARVSDAVAEARAMLGATVDGTPEPTP